VPPIGPGVRGSATAARASASGFHRRASPTPSSARDTRHQNGRRFRETPGASKGCPGASIGARSTTRATCNAPNRRLGTARTWARRRTSHSRRPPGFDAPFFFGCDDAEQLASARCLRQARHNVGCRSTPAQGRLRESQNQLGASRRRFGFRDKRCDTSDMRGGHAGAALILALLGHGPGGSASHTRACDVYRAALGIP